MQRGATIEDAQFFSQFFHTRSFPVVYILSLLQSIRVQICQISESFQYTYIMLFLIHPTYLYSNKYENC